MRGTQFLFDRADFMQKPIAVNLSIGSDFGPHDGTMAWEETIASFVGPDKPGHAIVAAAGNSGSIVDSPVHQSARVSSGTTMRVPIATAGAANGALEVWIAIRPGASISGRLRRTIGQLIAPVGDGSEAGDNTSSFNAAVINGSGPSDSPVPQRLARGDRGHQRRRGRPATTASSSTATAPSISTLEGIGDVAIGGNAAFVGPVREGTINLPATNPGDHRRGLYGEPPDVD